MACLLYARVLRFRLHVYYPEFYDSIFFRPTTTWGALLYRDLEEKNNEAGSMNPAPQCGSKQTPRRGPLVIGAQGAPQ